MKHLTDGVREAVERQCWYPALGMTLALPDICARVETPAGQVGVRYRRWFDANLASTYTVARRNGTRDVFMTAADCYALRCVFLHQGDLDVTAHDQAVLDRFVFIVSPPGIQIHMNATNRGGSQSLQLDVATFCMEICDAVDKWAQTVSAPDEAARLGALPRIQLMQTGGFSF